MKISKERLMEIIRHELKELDSSKIGGERVSKTQQAASLRDKVKNINDTNDIDNLERGIIQQFTKGLEDLAKVSNLNSGAIKGMLQRVYGAMQKASEKYQQGESTDEE